MGQNLSGVEQSDESAVALAQMVDPHRRVGQYHLCTARLRRGALRSGELPPSRANRRAASRSIKALSASRTSADFSFSPVNSCALANKSSSSANVVRISLTSLQGTKYIIN